MDLPAGFVCLALSPGKITLEGGLLLYLDTILRAAAAFILLMVITRLLGRKAISQMTFFDFAAAITLGTLTASLGMGSDRSAATAVLVIITFAALVFITDLLHLKIFAFRKLAGSEPVVLIRNGKLVESNMRHTRITIESLNSLLREKNAFNIADVEFAVFENDGKLSVLLKSQKQPVTPSDLGIPTVYKGLSKELVIDGQIMEENLRDANLSEKWLKEQLADKDIYDVKDVFFAALDTGGELYVSKGLEGREKHGQYGIE